MLYSAKFAKVCIHSRTKTIFAGKLFGNKGLCNNYLEWEGGYRGKSQLKRGAGCKIEYIQGGRHYFFHSFSQTGKVVEELLEFKYLHLLTLELNWEIINSRCFDL